MTKREVIDIQLERLFGGKFPHKIQCLVDEELNRGHWVEGYDLAVCQLVICGFDAGKLLELVLSQHPELKIEGKALMESVHKDLPQSLVKHVAWIVDESGAYALNDSLRVSRA